MLDFGWPIDLIVDQRDLCRRLREEGAIGSSRKRFRICPTGYRPELCLENGLVPKRSERIHIFDRSTGSFE
jgi:hypothetical protein